MGGQGRSGVIRGKRVEKLPLAVEKSPKHKDGSKPLKIQRKMKKKLGKGLDFYVNLWQNDSA